MFPSHDRTATDGTPIPASDHNSLKEALGITLVPRNSAGVATDLGGGLGSTVYRWATSYVNSLFIGAIASLISFEDSAGTLRVRVGGIVVAEFGATSFKINSGVNNLLESNTTGFKALVMGTVVGEFTATGLTLASLANNLITRPKMATGSEISPSNSGAFSDNTNSFVDITNMTDTITTTGGKVICMITHKSSSGDARNELRQVGSTTSFDCQIRFLRDATVIATYQTGIMFDDSSTSRQLAIPTSAYSCVDDPASGTYTYKVQLSSIAGGHNIDFTNSHLVLLEV